MEMNMNTSIRITITSILFLATIFSTGAYAQRGEVRERGAESNRSWIQETGLQPVFPKGYQCPKITSAFAATTDGGGNRRDPAIHGGKHGGVDIGFDVGHPLIAVAGGQVVAKGPESGDGAQMEGIFLWLRHSPDDTGLPFWTFSKYQHLKERPALNIGDRVRPGKVIALGGDTGTYSRKFGGSLPHLHMSTFISEHEDYEVAGRNSNLVRARESLHVDMMILFIPGITMDKARSNPQQDGIDKRLTVAASTWEGRLSDPAARLVWPVACKTAGQ
jgi:murein DD-endopeptidase MepM/ murein hydrolase activator NlpD